jgi:hypothetical protein
MRAVWIQDSKPEPPDLSLVKFGQLNQQFFALRQKENPHHPMVIRGLTFPNQPPALGTLDESDNRVVALLEKFGQFADRRPAAARKSCDPEKQLVLLRRKVMEACSSFAEAQKLPQLVPEIGQLPQGWKRAGRLESVWKA